MNSKTTIIGLVTAVAVLSGAMGLSVTGAFSDLTIAEYTPSSATGFLMGHLVIEAHNENGELIAYRAGDNIVVDDGEQCILKMLFASPSAADNTGGRGEYTHVNTNVLGEDACTGTLTGAWDVIAVGLGTTEPTVLDVVLESEVTDTGLKRMPASTKNWQNGTGHAVTTTEIVLAHTFTSTGDKTITESGLFNSTLVAGSGMLAHKTFAGVVLANGDSITVQWTFTVGN